MSKFSRSKGQRGERTVAKLLQEKLRCDVSRELSASRDGGCDIKIQLDDITYLIEVKFHTKVSQSIVNTWWEQALEQSKLQEETYLNPVPVLIYKQTHWKKWECRIPWNHIMYALHSRCLKRPAHDDMAEFHVTMPIDILCLIMQANRLNTISNGTITTTDNNDVDRKNLGIRA